MGFESRLAWECSGSSVNTLCDIGQINLLSIKLCFLICEMKMLTYLLHKEVVRIKQDNPSKSTSDCHTTSDKHMLSA